MSFRDDPVEKIMKSIAVAFDSRFVIWKTDGLIMVDFLEIGDAKIVIGFSSGEVRVTKNHFDSKEIKLDIEFIKGLCIVNNEILVYGAGQKVFFLDKNLSNIEERIVPFELISCHYSAQSSFFAMAVVKDSGPELLAKKISDHDLETEYCSLPITFLPNIVKIYNYFLYVSGDTVWEKWNLSTNLKEISVNILGIFYMTLSPKGCFISSNDQLSFIPSENETEIQLIASDVKRMVISADNYLYTIGNDLKIIDISGASIEVLLTSEETLPYSEFICIGIEYVFIASKTEIKRINIKESLSIKQILKVQSSIIGFHFSSAGDLFIATSDNILTKFEYNCTNMTYIEKVKEVYYEDTISCIALHETQVGIGNNEKTINIYSTVDLKFIENIPCHELPICGLFYIKNCLVSVAYEQGRLELSYFQGTLLKKLSGHFSFFVSNTKNLFFFGDTKLYISDEQGNIKEQESRERNIVFVKCNEEYLVVVDNEIVIYEVEEFGIICSVEFSGMKQRTKIKCLEIIDDNLIVATTNMIHCLSIQNRCFIGSLEVETTIREFKMHQNFLYFCTNNGIYSCRNIFNTDEFDPFLLGPGLPSLLFTNVFNKIFQSRQGTESILPEHIYKWTILPQCINIVHLLAYKNCNSLLKSSFKKSANFLKSISNISPLTIALRRQYRDTTDYLIKKLVRECSIEGKQNMMVSIEDDLPEINISLSSSISDLYREVLVAPKQLGLPTYGKVKATEIVIASPGHYINPMNFMEDVTGSQEQYVTFLTSTVRLQFGFGSSESILFLKSLLLCTDTDVFITPLVKNYLNYKWKDSQMILKTHSFLYFTFLLLLTLDVFVPISYHTWISVVLILLNCLDLCYEVFQMKHHFMEYFHSKTNIFDLIRIVMVYHYVICQILWENGYYDSFESYQEKYSTIIILSSYLRGILYFKMFGKTRYMIKMIEEIVIDSAFFAILLLYMLLALTTFFHFVNSSKNYFENFTTVYKMGFGEFDIDFNSSIQSLCFYLISFALPLIMFNLLVAVMGGTYERVYSGMEEMDYKAMTQLILESEIIFSNFTTRKANKMYLQKCIVGSEREVDVTDKLKSKVKKCINNMNELIKVTAAAPVTNFDSMIQAIMKDKEEKIKALADFKSSFVDKKTEIISKLIENNSKIINK